MSRDPFECERVLSENASSSSDQSTEEDLTSLKPLILQTVLVTLVLLAGIVVLATMFEEPTRVFANWVVDELGYTGIFLGVLATDAFTIPIPPDTYLLVAVASEEPVVPVLATITGASLAAGLVAYHFGPALNKVSFLRHRIDSFRPRGEALFRRYGIWTVAIAAMTPIPFSVVCWFAGIYHMNLGRFFVATLARIPRFILYYYIFVLGWSPVS